MSDWTDVKNDRRCWLIDKEIENTLLDEEKEELEDLQQQMFKHIAETTPLPIEKARQLHKELLEKREKMKVSREIGSRTLVLSDLPTNYGDEVARSNSKLFDKFDIVINYTGKPNGQKAIVLDNVIIPLIVDSLRGVDKESKHGLETDYNRWIYLHEKHCCIGLDNGCHVCRLISDRKKAKSKFEDIKTAVLVKLFQ